MRQMGKTHDGWTFTSLTRPTPEPQVRGVVFLAFTEALHNLHLLAGEDMRDALPRTYTTTVGTDSPNAEAGFLTLSRRALSAIRPYYGI